MTFLLTFQLELAAFLFKLLQYETQSLVSFTFITIAVN